MCAISVDWASKLISIPQADLTFVSGTLYDLDTEALRLEMAALLDDEVGMPFEDIFFHETQSTIVGVTYARKITIINGYSIQFTPDSQWSVRLNGSNNDIWDIESGILIQNQVQVIPNNSAGLVVTATSGLTSQESTDLSNIRKRLLNRIHTNPTTGRIEIYNDADTAVELSADIWEDIAALTAYQGQGIERQDKLT